MRQQGSRSGEAPVSQGQSSSRESLVNGRYRVVRMLGEGAMGSVHLVADTLDDDGLLALKMIREGVLTQQRDKLFRNEFAAMTQLRHPNVVEVYDFGTISGAGDHFFTMEFVDGKSLLEACQRADPDEIHGYAVQICRALEYIHSQGFVHFDLKPDNIMVGPGKVAKVMDFGLVEKGSFFQSRMLKGTVAYVAPEMIRGGKIDHRLDLYSLGAVLFHVITGRILFPGDTISDVLQRHLRDAPNLRDNLPRPIPAPILPILQRLLAKNPDDRYGSAAEVLADLERLLHAGTTAESVDALAFYRLGSRLVARDAQLGRLLDVFWERVTEPRLNTPPVVLVAGKSGMGKSRLLQELRHEAQLNGVRFIHGACIQNGGQSYLPFAEILRNLVREILGSSLSRPSDAPPATASTAPPTVEDSTNPGMSSEQASRSLLYFAKTLGVDEHLMQPTTRLSRFNDPISSTVAASDTAPPPRTSSWPPPSSGPLLSEDVADREAKRLLELYAPALSMLVPEDAELAALIQDGEGKDGDRAGQEKEWLIASLTSFLLDLSRARPIVLYCSDLHWADDLTVELFARLGRAAAEAARPSELPSRLMLCACFRDDEIAGTALEKAAAELASGRVALPIHVGPLAAPAVAEMIGSMLGHVEIPDDALRILVDRTGGVPFAIEATIQDLLERRALGRRGLSWYIGAEDLGGTRSVSTVTEALDRTLQKLPALETEVVRLLAVFNRPASAPLLRQAGGLPAEALSQALLRLRNRHLLQRGWTDGQYHWSLRHAKLRDHIYASIAPAEREKLHEAAGSALDSLYNGSERYLLDIAQHLEQAGRIERAIGYFQAAGEQAERVYDLNRAAALFTRAYDALDAIPDAPARRLFRADLAVSIAQVSYYTPSEQGNERLRRALESAEAAGDPERCARIQSWLGRAYYALGRNQEAIRCFQELMRLTEGKEDDQIRALPYQVLGRVYIFMGRFEEARDYLERAAALLRGRRGSEDDLSYVLGMLGGTYVYLGNFARSEELTQESIAIARQLGHRTRLGQGQVYLGITYVIRGEWGRARAALEPGVESSLAVRNVSGAGTGSSFLGLTYLAAGDARRAVELCTFGRDHIAKAGGTWTFSMVGAHLAEALLASGEPEAALRVAEETVPVIDAGERWGESCLHLAMGRIHARLGNAERALQSFGKALRAAEEQQKSPTFTAKVHLATGAFHLAAGARAEGTALALRALSMFEALGMPWYAERARALLGGTLDISPCP